MNALASYQFEQETVRVVMIGEEPWWVAADVAKVLGYRDSANMVRNLDDDEKGIHISDTLGGQQELNVISESGLFAAILKSRKPEAKRFRRWVTGEVLPTLRKTGRYQMHDDPPELPSPAIDDAELPRLTAAIGIIREARQVWGRAEVQRLWVHIGLPNPIAQATAEVDDLAARVAALVADRDTVRKPELAEALGMPLSTRLDMRLSAALRLLGWHNAVRRIDGVQQRVWVPATSSEEA